MIQQAVRLASAGVALAASAALLSPVAHAAGPAVKKVKLLELYSRYAHDGQSVTGLPEYGDGKHILFTAVVVEQSQGLVGNTLLVAADPSQPDEPLARLTGYDEKEARKMAALPAGAKFSAICALALTSGSDFLALHDCVVKP
ncbi:hypothetical protein [Burkholderia glumae]|uniref:hypothetical protein n=1 Tax=Burkholderia glumae TaxID=337 RepID=UPI001373F4EE|nr:hypothetical protein [Burkholderia glumae]MCR1766081.1 hypothetical protein [Burkholderia glumae]QHP89837.1 hypothetical protein EXE55_02030 [Burkholderia glumae]QKM47111.1 hypothetical protein B7760_01119 [Burkholderia glumae]UVS95859.1 hypothetical protein EFP19_08880 [Burkholderia glumae]